MIEHYAGRNAEPGPELFSGVLAAREPDSAQEINERSARPAVRPPLDLASLAAAPYEQDKPTPNGSSIGFLLEHRGASLLLLGDGHAEVYGPALAGLLASRGEGQTRIDAVKLSHHGSRHNTTGQLALARARHYLISSSGKLYGHPDDETLARLIEISFPVPRRPSGLTTRRRSTSGGLTSPRGCAHSALVSPRAPKAALC